MKLTSSEVGTLWGEYINGTMADVVNQYMLSIIEDKEIKAIFQDAVTTFNKQKKQIMLFLNQEGFPIPIGFTELDWVKGKGRLFTDVFCLRYLHTMTLHGLFGHTNAFSVSVRKDVREFYDACNDVAKKMYHKTIELMLNKGIFQRDPLFYPTEHTQIIETKSFVNGFFDKSRRLAATEVMSVSMNIKKSVMAKALLLAFKQVAKDREVVMFLSEAEKLADKHISLFSKMMHDDYLPVPQSIETEVTTLSESPFSEKLMLYHIGFLAQTSQQYHGFGLASAMRTDLVASYEKTILKNLWLTKQWFTLMVKHKWLDQPPLAPNRINEVTKS